MMSAFCVPSPVLPIMVTRGRPTNPTRRYSSEDSKYSSSEADQKSLKTQGTTSSKDSDASSKSQSRRHRLRRFLTFKKDNAVYEKMEDKKPKPKKVKKPVKEYEPTPYDQYYGIAYGPWF
jgi:hypothetical protein